MAFHRLRRALLVAASTAVLAACGGGDVVSQFSPQRLVVFGDAFADLGQRGARYTINDGSVNNWTQQLGARYGVPVVASASGGTSYAIGSARVTAKPDAAGNAATPTVTEQVGSFLSTQGVGANDLVIVNAGTADVLAQFAAVNNGAQTAPQAVANLRQAGREVGAQVRRLVQAGARHVVLVGPYNLGRSPLATLTNRADLLSELSGRFNDEMITSIVDLGASVLYVDAALYLNLVSASPTGYSLSNAAAIACISADPGPGIGIGPGQVNSALCNNGTLLPGIDPAQYLFADAVYPTPAGHRLFGDYAYDRIRQRW